MLAGCRAIDLKLRPQPVFGQSDDAHLVRDFSTRLFQGPVKVCGERPNAPVQRQAAKVAHLLLGTCLPPLADKHARKDDGTKAEERNRARGNEPVARVEKKDKQAGSNEGDGADLK